jgi:hypothetical protein
MTRGTDRNTTKDLADAGGASGTETMEMEDGVRVAKIESFEFLAKGMLGRERNDRSYHARIRTADKTRDGGSEDGSTSSKGTRNTPLNHVRGISGHIDGEGGREKFDRLKESEVGKKDSVLTKAEVVVGSSSSEHKIDRDGAGERVTAGMKGNLGGTVNVNGNDGGHGASLSVSTIRRHGKESKWTSVENNRKQR